MRLSATLARPDDQIAPQYFFCFLQEDSPFPSFDNKEAIFTEIETKHTNQLPRTNFKPRGVDINLKLFYKLKLYALINSFIRALESASLFFRSIAYCVRSSFFVAVPSSIAALATATGSTSINLASRAFGRM